MKCLHKRFKTIMKNKEANIRYIACRKCSFHKEVPLHPKLSYDVKEVIKER